MKSLSFYLDEKGIAGITVAALAATIAGASVGAPVAADEIDTQPDSPFYGLEKAGESIKEATFAGGHSWNIERARERTQEYRNMVKKGKAKNHANLLNQAENRIHKGTNNIQNRKDIEKTQSYLNRHTQVLENLRENVPSEARPAISLAISRSVRGKSIVETAQVENKPGEIRQKVKEQIREELENMEQEMKKFREEIRENLGKGISENTITARIELRTAKQLMKRERKIIRENIGEKIPQMVQEVQNRIEYSTMYSENGNGLEKAIEANKHHLQVLENVYEKVPNKAKAAISLAIERSSRHIQILENIKENQGFGQGLGQEIKQKIESQMKKIRKNYESELKNLQDRIHKKQENMKQIIDEYKEKARKTIENLKKKGKEIQENTDKVIENIIENTRDNKGPGKGKNSL